ncbi:MAG: EamA family transporter [Candidatus Eremiobacteraeota bacterium]|nr:EamA family transporter [Candidatus Eremiobacteraeota bacterium]
MRTSRNTTAVVVALLAVYIFWGSTAPAIKVAVRTIPPWYLAAIRFLIAGTILWTWCRIRGVPLPAVRDWRGAAITGTLLLTLGNGVFSWCLLYIPAGLGSLFFALNPLWNAVIGAAFYRERLSWLAIGGIALGLGGMAYVVSPSGAEHLPLFAVLAATFASIAWSAGSMIQRRYPATDFLQMSAMQMFVGFAELSVFGAIAGERLNVAEFSALSVGALVYLIVFGSLVAFSAYIWLARNVETVLASTYSYVNPVVAIGISVLVLHETLTWHTLLGAGIVLAGVALMLLPVARMRPTTR